MPHNSEVPEISTCTRDSITSTFDLYIKSKVAFKPKYLDLLQKASSLEIVKPFFENFLPSVFGMKPTPKMTKSWKTNNTKKRKKLAEDAIVLQWVKKLKQIDSLNRRNHGEFSVNFREYFMNFYKRLESETTFQIKEVAMNNYSNSRQDNDSNQEIVEINSDFNDNDISMEIITRTIS